MKLLDGRLRLNNSGRFILVVCGGTALNALKLVTRTTKDVDIIALMDSSCRLIDPAPMPEALEQAAQEVAETLHLSHDWLNNGPSSGEGGLFRLGLPAGFTQRLIQGYQGENLKVFYAGRLDLIHFKLYAAIDQFGSYHASDLKAINPSEKELLDAMKWAITHDPSEGFRVAAQMFLKKFGYEQLAEKI